MASAPSGTSSPAAAAGHAVVVVSALSFACNNAFAVLAYDGGATPLSLLAVRMLFALAALTLLMKVLGVDVALPRRERRAALGLGVLTGGVSFCLMTAFDLIAVGLAVLIFYLNPVLTGLGAWITGRERLTPGLVAGMAACFGGLALALELRGGSGDLAGMALAAAAAVFMAALLLLSARVLRDHDPRVVTIHMHVSATSLAVLACLAAGEFSLPETARGWTGMIAVPVFYTIAIAAFFAGIARIGPLRTSLAMNLEPIASIAAGFALLGQVLTPRQLAGAAVVVAAVTAVKWLDGRSLRRRPGPAPQRRIQR